MLRSPVKRETASSTWLLPSRRWRGARQEAIRAPPERPQATLPTPEYINRSFDACAMGRSLPVYPRLGLGAAAAVQPPNVLDRGN
jgi:hypothetical protein